MPAPLSGSPDPLSGPARELERVVGVLSGAARRVESDRGVLAAADPGMVAAAMWDVINDLEDVLERIDQVRFGGPDPLSGQERLPIGD